MRTRTLKQRLPSEIPFQDALGKAVRLRRQVRGISQEKLAALCGVEPTDISEIERGLKSISLQDLFVLAAALDTLPNLLVQKVLELL